MKYSKSTNGFYSPDFDYDKLPDDLIDVTAVDYEKAIEARSAGGVLDVIDGQLVIMQPAPSSAYEAVDGEWVLNQDLQDALDLEHEAAQRAAFQTELDTRMNTAVAIAQPLEYANARKKLSIDKAARLAAYNAYIDQLAELEYSSDVVWPNEPM